MNFLLPGNLYQCEVCLHAVLFRHFVVGCPETAWNQATRAVRYRASFRRATGYVFEYVLSQYLKYGESWRKEHWSQSQKTKFNGPAISSYMSWGKSLRLNLFHPSASQSLYTYTVLHIYIVYNIQYIYYIVYVYIIQYITYVYTYILYTCI